MTAALDFRAATTPSRLRLPADFLRDLERVASDRGVGVEELAGRFLVDALPGLVAELVGQWLRVTAGLAYAVDAPSEAAAGDIASPVWRRLAGHFPVDAATPLPEGKGATSESLTTSPITRLPRPARQPKGSHRGAAG